MRVMWIIAIHRKTYPHCRLRAIASNRPQLLGLGLSADYSFAVRIHILSLRGGLTLSYMAIFPLIAYTIGARDQSHAIPARDSIALYFHIVR